MMFLPNEDPVGDDGWAELRRELDRCRRYGRRFGLVQFVPAGDADSPLLEAVRTLVRRVDVVWDDQGVVYALLPEADAGACAGLMARVDARCAEARYVARSAVFPEDGVTSGALLRALDGGRRARDAEEAVQAAKALARARRRWRVSPRAPVAEDGIADSPLA
jgi:hypothetical protein